MVSDPQMPAKQTQATKGGCRQVRRCEVAGKPGPALWVGAVWAAVAVSSPALTGQMG